MPPTARPVNRVLAPLREFLRDNAAGAVLLLAATAIALAWSNLPFGDSYASLWSTKVGVGLGDLSVSLTLQHWVNDGLMAIFFLVVGLEIKRELLVGELSTRHRAVLPVVAALGGAVVPALIFIGIVGTGSAALRGWAIPMATDIAFALGVLALLGRRVPIGLRIFVTALAIVDDLIAVLVIALAYTGDLSLPALAVTLLIIGLLVAMNRLGFRQPALYLVVGVALWLAVHELGLHATIAGVLLAITIPAGRRGSQVDPDESSPMVRIEHALTPLATFAIVPLFALANAGVGLSAELFQGITDPVVLGVGAGLVIGKQIGITLAAWLVVRLGQASLPAGVSWKHIYAAGWLCGIGFTMSLFIAELAYSSGDALALAKLGILGASAVAGIVGYFLLRRIESPSAADS